MGPALMALAVGGGITLYNALDADPVAGEHGIVYPMIGAALLLASLFNPLAMRGAGTFLLVVGVVATVTTPWNPGWTLVVALALWSAWEFARIARTGDDEPQTGSTYAESRDGARTPVAASC
jgi:membrane protein implicated in regulation of membrane protease activity